MGGTGKTPHIEYLLYQLQYLYKTATLSRGYGRTSHGFVVAEGQTTAAVIGDEPRQFKAKYPETIVCVCEDRVLAVPRLLSEHPETDVILLDDAFQHRSIRPGLSVLVTEYANLFTRDALLPVGWLREPKQGFHRADIIVVSKCPANITAPQKQAVIDEIKPYRYQHVYFSAIEYGPLYSFTEPGKSRVMDKQTNVLLVCGIARHGALKDYLDEKAARVFVRDYRDHHRFDRYDLEAIRETYNNLGDMQKIIVTTEKDAARLEEHRHWFLQNKIEIFVQPIAVRFLFNDGAAFNEDILRYIEVTKQKTVH
jgi:tetraacyldisaccharide 4'-kinase